MEIYLLRHGAAEPPESGVADRKRTLTPKGRRAVHAVLQRACAAKIKPTLILASPFTRARETAAIAKKVLHCDKLAETRALLPNVSPAVLWKEIGTHRGIEELIIVGHQPQLNRLASLLLEAALTIDFRKGALLWISVRGKVNPPRGVLGWMITPQLARGGK